ncbi:hypothetical protein CCO03_12390 [Comamonas serinivorans]|uniref:Fumarylacetoacetate hydrolase n=1 Tax=Comamonas serinivorans TaxID=1082851 RepID=A0A1Y0EQ05_9BURK|nr:hypothetical protein CCO03_12390 [Comamonas serinivorans]
MPSIHGRLTSGSSTPATAWRLGLAAGCAALLAGCAGQAIQQAEAPGCLDAVAVAALTSAYEARIPADNPPVNLSPAAAACSRAKFQAETARLTGPLVGYKAGLTNPAVQKRFHTDQPVWGSLGKAMLLTSPAQVPAQFGARPVFEADLLVRVKDARINQASTPEQVLASVDQIVPFIELPDLMVQKPTDLNGNALTAINVGARLGVTGAPLAVPAEPQAQATLVRQLADMRVHLRDQHGKSLAEGKGADVLGNPLQAVVWLAGALKAEGRSLQPGQYVSLGSFSPLLPPKAGLQVNVHYEGVPGLAAAQVSFR